MPRRNTVDPNKVAVRVIEKGEPIVIPNEENLPPEEVKRLRHNEKMRRFNARKKGLDVVVPQTKQDIRKIDTSELVELSKDARNLAIQTLNKKLENLYLNPEELAKINIAQLATVFGILFDKGQLLNGLSTENISIKSKIDITMNSDSALQELNKMREKYAESNG